MSCESRKRNRDRPASDAPFNPAADDVVGRLTLSISHYLFGVRMQQMDGSGVGVPAIRVRVDFKCKIKGRVINVIYLNNITLYYHEDLSNSV